MRAPCILSTLEPVLQRQREARRGYVMCASARKRQGERAGPKALGHGQGEEARAHPRASEQLSSKRS